jgi:hypothetical protein
MGHSIEISMRFPSRKKSKRRKKWSNNTSGWWSICYYISKHVHGKVKSPTETLGGTRTYYPAKTRRWGFGGLGPFSPSLASDCDWLRTGNDRSHSPGALPCIFYTRCNVCGWWAEGISQKLAMAGMAVGGQGNDGLRYCTGDSPRSLLRPVDPVNCFSSHASTVPCRFLSANFFFLVNSSTEFYLSRIPSPFLN